jgi:hypothetical protein
MLFEMGKEGLEITPQSLIISQFKKLWTRDKSKEKKKAKIELAYVYYYSDWRSPYRIYPEKEERSERIILDIFEKGWKIDEKILEACQKYEELNTTDSMLLLQDARGAVGKLRAYFRDVDLTERDEKTGKPIYSAKDLMLNLKQVGSVIKGMKELQEEIAKEQYAETRIKGGGRAGAFEDPQ